MATKRAAKRTTTRATKVPKKALKKAATRKTIAKTAAVKKAAKKSPARKATPRKVAAKKTTAKRAVAKKSAAKKTTVRKAATKKATAKKTAARKATAKKVTVKQVAATKTAKQASTRRVAGKAGQPAPKTADTKKRAGTAPRARTITPEQALANTRKLLEAKQEHDRQVQPWQKLDDGHGPAPQVGHESEEAAAKAEQLHAAESRVQAIQGSNSTQDRHNQGKRDNR